MDAMDHLRFLVKMKRIAKEARSRGRRCRYRNKTRQEALDFVRDVERAGGTWEDAAELMSMYRGTLIGWIERETRPEPRRRVEVHLHIN